MPAKNPDRAILVAEDDRGINGMLKMILEDEGHQVILAETVAAAEEVLHAAGSGNEDRTDSQQQSIVRIGMLLLDLQMPFGRPKTDSDPANSTADSAQAILQALQRANLEDVPVAVMSALPVDLINKIVREAGVEVSAIIPKPFPLDTIIDTVASNLS